MDAWLIVLIVIGLIVLILLIWFIATMNSLRQLKVKVEEADSGIDVALTKRYDVLSKMVDTVKEYTDYEAETFENVVKWRQNMPDELTVEQKQEFMEKMDEAKSEINVVAENYPDLKAAEVFTNLQNSISDVEEHLQASRRMFNANVSKLNRKIVTFPISIVANMINMQRHPFFEAEASKREDVDINLG